MDNMYGIYSKLSNFDELEYTKRELKDLLESASVNPSEATMLIIAAKSERLLKLLEQERYNPNYSPYQIRWVIKGGAAKVSRELRELEDIEEVMSRKDFTKGGYAFEIVKELWPFGGYKRICGLILKDENEEAEQ